MASDPLRNHCGTLRNPNQKWRISAVFALRNHLRNLRNPCRKSLKLLAEGCGTTAEPGPILRIGSAAASPLALGRGGSARCASSKSNWSEGMRTIQA